VWYHGFLDHGVVQGGRKQKSACNMKRSVKIKESEEENNETQSTAVEVNFADDIKELY
jgi:hypothetical protein